MLSINTFRDKLNAKGGQAPVNRYEVFIPGREGSSFSAFLCEQAELPGKTMLTVEDKLYGPVRKIGYGQMFIDTTMTFICTAEGWAEKEFFDKWQNDIVDPDLFDASYYNDYTSDILLTTYKEDNSSSYGIRFNEAFPLNVGAINLGWGQNNEYARLSVTFAYRKWEQVSSGASSWTTDRVRDFLATGDTSRGF
jgi:hypothetical protein